MLSIRVKINSKECLVIRNFYLLNYREDFDNFRDIYKRSGKQDMFPEAQQCVLDRLADIDFTEKSLNNIGFFLSTQIFKIILLFMFNCVRLGSFKERLLC